MCEMTSPESDLRQVMTMKLDKRMHECAQTLNDGMLLAKLYGGDAIAQELKCHRACLTALYNRKRSHLRSLEKDSHHTKYEPDAYPLVLSELVNNMIETSLQLDEPTVFPLSDISHQRLAQLGVDIPNVNTTRLKDKLLTEIPELEAHKKWIGILLAFQKDVALSLSKASEHSDALVMAKAAKVLRRHILDHQSKFGGIFPGGCVKDAIPPILLQFVGMELISNHSCDLGPQSLTKPFLSCYSITVIPDTKRGQQHTDTPKKEKHHSQCIWDSLSLPKLGRKVWWKCSMSMASAFPMTGGWIF